jgi:hypothetical protein
VIMDFQEWFIVTSASMLGFMILAVIFRLICYAISGH